MSKKNKNKTFKMDADTERLIAANMEKSMPTVWEAFVEIITNCDSAYAMAHGKEYGYQGDVRIELNRAGIKYPTIIRFKDRAIGMSFNDIQQKLMSYFKVTTTTQRSMFGKGFKDCLALGDITIQSVKKDEKGKLRYSEVFFAGIRTQNKNEIRYQDSEIDKEILNRLGTNKARVEHIVEISIPPEANSKYAMPQADNIKERLPNHYALSRLMDRENGNLKVTFDNGKDKPELLTYVRPEAKVAFDDKTTFRVNDKNKPNGVEATLKIWKLDEPIENDDNNPRFKKLGISVYSAKGCHAKNFLDKKIENDDYRKRYFGELQCPYIYELAKEYNDNLNQKHINPDNNIAIIEDTRLQGINEDHPFIKKHLYPWAISILNKLIAEDKKKDELEKGKSDEKLKKIMDDAFKELNKDMNMEDADDDSGITDDGKKQWNIIFPNRELVVGEKARGWIRTKTQYLKAGVDTVEFKSDKSYDLIKVDSDSKKLEVSENKPDIVKTFFDYEATKPGEQTFKIMHGGSIKTEFSIKVIPFRNKNLDDLLEFEHKQYTVGNGKTKVLKVFAKVPEAITENQNLNITIVDDSVVQYKGPTILEIVEGSNYAEATVSVKGLKLNGSTRVAASFQDNFAEANIKVTEKEEPQKNIYGYEFTERKLAGKRAAWQENTLLISTTHPVVRKFLGSSKPDFPNSTNPAWLTLLWEMLCEKFAEKKVQQLARKGFSDYADVKNNPDLSYVITQTGIYYENEKAIWIEKFMSKMISSKLCDMGRDE